MPGGEWECWGQRLISAWVDAGRGMLGTAIDLNLGTRTLGANPGDGGYLGLWQMLGANSGDQFWGQRTTAGRQGKLIEHEIARFWESIWPKTSLIDGIPIASGIFLNPNAIKSQTFCGRSAYQPYRSVRTFPWDTLDDFLALRNAERTD